jgi:predicted NUDIX family NTP pyrophosphohydrolase
MPAQRYRKRGWIAQRQPLTAHRLFRGIVNATSCQNVASVRLREGHFDPAALTSNTFDIEWPPEAVDGRVFLK